jgi:UDP-glucuronate decarboxylase
MTRSLVTGGAGFLGSHLVDRLLARGDEVVALDNFYTGRADNVAHLRDQARFTLVEHDVVSPFPRVGAMGGRFDRIFHLACPASPPAYQRDPIYTTKISFLGTLHALERAQADGARLLQASTSEVYGDPEQHPQRESYRGAVNTLGPRACYDEGKRAAETLFFDYHRQHGLRIKVVRLFNTYGPRMHPHDGRVVSNFVVSALTGTPLTIYGEGEQTRSFCYVDDLIDGLVAMMASPDDVTGPINLGNPGEFTIAELAAEVLRQVGTDPGVTYHPLPTDDPVRAPAPTSRSRARASASSTRCRCASASSAPSPTSAC